MSSDPIASAESQQGDGSGFNLSGDSGRSPKLSRSDEQRFEKLYSKNWRTIRRWIDRGAANNDPCPLNDPARMPGWWTRNNTWRIPQEIEAAAISSTRVADPQPDPIVTRVPDVVPPANVLPPGQKIDLESFDPEEGDRLRELKQIQAAKFAQLKKALMDGQDCSVLESKYLKLSETIDKIETRVTERLKKRGLYILRAEVERDVASNAELLRQSRSAMVRRVLESCPSLNMEHRAEVSAAVENARAMEERMLCRLDLLTTEDLLRELSA